MGTNKTIEKKTIQYCVWSVRNIEEIQHNYELNIDAANSVCVLLGAVELPEASGVVKKRRLDASNSKAGNTVKQIIAC